MRRLIALVSLIFAAPAVTQQPAEILLRPSRVFDGVNPQPHEGWSVLIRGDRIAEAGPNVAATAGARVIDLPGMSLVPGMIEGGPLFRVMASRVGVLTH